MVHRFYEKVDHPASPCGSINVQTGTTHPTMPYRCRDCRIPLQTLLAPSEELPPPSLQLRGRYPSLPAHLANVLPPQQPQHHLRLPLRAPPLGEAGRPPQAARAVLLVRPSRHPAPPLSWTPDGLLIYRPEKSGALYAQELGNVSKACRILGYSRQHFYEIRRNFQVHGAEGLLDRLPGAKGPHPNRVAPPIEKAIVAHALKHPTHGAQGVADELMLRGLQVSSGGVRGVWMRNGLKIRHERLLRLEETVRKRKIKLTEEQIRALERFDPEFRERHIEVHATGDL